MWVCILAL